MSDTPYAKEQPLVDVLDGITPSDLANHQLFVMDKIKAAANQLRDLLVNQIPAAPAGYRHELVRLSTSTDAAPQGFPEASEGSPAVAAPFSRKQIEQIKSECIPSDLSPEELHVLCDMAMSTLAQ